MNNQLQRNLIGLGLVIIAIGNLMDSGMVALLGFIVACFIVFYGSVQDAMK